jgi:mono/diheme cytochrome c family protein
MTRRLLLVLVLLLTPFVIGLLFTYDVLKIDWISMMEIQPSFGPYEDPLPAPEGSVPVQGLAFLPGQGAPENPVPVDEVSVQRGQVLYEPHCALCHGNDAAGNGPFANLIENQPANLLESTEMSDGEMFLIITYGIPGRMPALHENLPEPRDRWDVVNYIRELQGQAGQ